MCYAPLAFYLFQMQALFDTLAEQVHGDRPFIQAPNMSPCHLRRSELLRAVKHAVDNACAHVRATGGDDGQISRLMMAVRLSTAVAEGELDPAKLKLVALGAVDSPAKLDRSPRRS